MRGQRLLISSHGVAIDVSPRRKPWDEMVRERAAVRRKKLLLRIFLSPLTRLENFPRRSPRLTRWATFWRCSTATSKVLAAVEELSRAPTPIFFLFLIAHLNGNA